MMRVCGFVGLWVCGLVIGLVVFGLGEWSSLKATQERAQPHPSATHPPTSSRASDRDWWRPELMMISASGSAPIMGRTRPVCVCAEGDGVG